MNERVPFKFAIESDELLGKAWKRLSLPQQVILKALYGLPFSEERELTIWSGLQGAGQYDELGYLTGVDRIIPYEPKEYDILTGVIGRQSGKSTELTAFGAAYEIALGGHTQMANGLEIMFAFIAHNKGLAQMNMKGILRVLRSSPLLNDEIMPDEPGDEIVRFKHGIIMQAFTNTLTSSRGYGVMGVVMDELGFWYKDAQSANPDKEVETALQYAMQRFEHAKQFRITTPWTKEGLAYEAWLAGTEGRNYKAQKDADRDLIDQMDDHLVVYAPTAAMEVPEPFVTRKKLARAKKKDPMKFARESLAKFIDAQSGFLSHIAINEAVDKGQRLKDVVITDAYYVAVMDPAFRTDEYTLTIGHNDKVLGVVQDLIMGWTPEPGARLNPGIVLDAVKVELDRFGISTVYSDQHQLESLQELALDREFGIHGFDLTRVSKPKVMQSMNTKLNQGRLVLKEDAKQTQQLKELVRTVTPTGGYTVAAPPGKHDDRAMVLALMTYIADQQPAVEVKDIEAELDPGRKHEKSERLRDVAARVRQRLNEDQSDEAAAILGYTDYLSAYTDAA